jgi:hypothetical protein
MHVAVLCTHERVEDENSQHADFEDEVVITIPLVFVFLLLFLCIFGGYVWICW